jgi:protein-disulfide isomerase
MKKNKVIILASVLLLLATAGIYWYKKSGVSKVLKPVISAEYDLVFGSEEASIQVFVFFDYFCSHCRKFFTQVYPEIEKEYINTRKIQLVLKPVFFSSHAQIIKAYKAAICLNKHGQFQVMHDLLLVEPEVVFSQHFDQLIEEYVQRNSLYAECFYGGSVDQYLDETQKLFIANRFKGTPTFVINNKIYSGYHSFEQFKQVISKEYGNVLADN